MFVKQFWRLLLVCCFGAAFSVSTSALARDSNRVASHVLETILSERCFHFVSHANIGTSIGLALECTEQVSRLVRILDQDFVFELNGSVPEDPVLLVRAFKGAVSFRNELRELLSRPEIITYLDELRDALQTDTPFSLWQFTLERSGGIPKLALKRIAVLLQDSDAMAHASYLQLTGFASGDDEQASRALELLGMVNELLFRSPQVSLFPPGVEVRSHSYYHFYVIAYLSYAMNSRLIGKNGAPRWDQFLPFLFNATYCFIRRIQPPANWQEAPANYYSWRSYDANLHQRATANVYLGYLAVRWARNLANTHIATGLTESQFGRVFSRNPEGFTQKLLTLRP